MKKYRTKLLIVLLVIVEIITCETKSETIAVAPLSSPTSVLNTHAPPIPVEITPIPADDFSPRFDEFRRIDANGDQQITFAEFILADRPYIEDKSRLYHKQDLNGDGIVSKNEFVSYYRKKEEERRLREEQAENFFKQLVSLEKTFLVVLEKLYFDD
uniref:EF-hand domain-containing protein n=1 Tax=Wuchereria bancrofti TaxID=6293 RepID=A0AAF5PH11_WUCBA